MGFVYGSTFRLDSKGEIIITRGGDISFVVEKEKLAQDLIVLLRSHKNQYLFNLNFGLDYKQYLLDNSLSAFINNDIMPAVESYYFTERVNSIDAKKSGKSISLSIDMDLKNGENIVITLTL